MTQDEATESGNFQPSLGFDNDIESHQWHQWHQNYGPHFPPHHYGYHHPPHHPPHHIGHHPPPLHDDPWTEYYHSPGYELNRWGICEWSYADGHASEELTLRLKMVKVRRQLVLLKLEQDISEEKQVKLIAQLKKLKLRETAISEKLAALDPYHGWVNGKGGKGWDGKGGKGFDGKGGKGWDGKGGKGFDGKGGKGWDGKGGIGLAGKGGRGWRGKGGRGNGKGGKGRAGKFGMGHRLSRRQGFNSFDRTGGFLLSSVPEDTTLVILDDRFVSWASKATMAFQRTVVSSNPQKMKQLIKKEVRLEGRPVLVTDMPKLQFRALALGSQAMSRAQYSAVIGQDPPVNQDSGATSEAVLNAEETDGSAEDDDQDFETADKTRSHGCFAETAKDSPGIDDASAVWHVGDDWTMLPVARPSSVNSSSFDTRHLAHALPLDSSAHNHS